MELKGTKFQLKVWAYLSKIPRGSVKTYSQVAKAIENRLLYVYNAVGKNPYPPKIPCHRVIKSDGSRDILAKEVLKIRDHYLKRRV